MKTILVIARTMVKAKKLAKLILPVAKNATHLDEIVVNDVRYMFISASQLPRLNGLKAHRVFIDKNVLNDPVHGGEILNLVTIILMETKGTYYTI